MLAKLIAAAVISYSSVVDAKHLNPLRYLGIYSHKQSRDKDRDLPEHYLGEYESAIQYCRLLSLLTACSAAQVELDGTAGSGQPKKRTVAVQVMGSK